MGQSEEKWWKEDQWEKLGRVHLQAEKFNVTCKATQKHGPLCPGKHGMKAILRKFTLREMFISHGEMFMNQETARTNGTCLLPKPDTSQLHVKYLLLSTTD